MADIDDFSELLLEEAKRFLEKGVTEKDSVGQAAYFHASLNLAFCSFEAHINAIADDFQSRADLSILDKSVMYEREVKLVHGEHQLGNLKIYRLEDRVEFLYHRFSGTAIQKNASWAKFSSGLNLRNQLSHPKSKPTITETAVSQAIEGILEILEELYQVIYERPYPALKRGLHSKMAF